jgi:hypothetical protein
MKLKLNPTHEIAILLILLSVGAIIKNNFHLQVFMHLGATLGFGVIIFYVFKYLKKQEKNIWNTIISCLIIFLLLHYGAKPIDVLVTTLVIAFVVFSKFFMEWKGSPIFNPVVLGFFALEIFSNFIPSLKLSFVSWWGASYSFGAVPVALILIAIWTIFSFKAWRKWPVALSYLGFFAIFSILAPIIFKGSTLQSSFDLAKFIFTNSTIYFLAFIMLAEPRTSPLMRNQQIIYGLIAAVFSTISLLTNFPTSSLLAILVPNLYFFIEKWLRIRKMTAVKNTPAQA